MHIRSSTTRFQFLRCHHCQSTIVVPWFVKLRVTWSYICGWCFVVGNKFRYMRACFDCNQSTRMVLVASHFIVAPSKYLKLVVIAHEASDE